nr:MAG: hypothetical protein DIU78_14745 [Pseudomonadota bacterium]
MGERTSRAHAHALASSDERSLHERAGSDSDHRGRKGRRHPGAGAAAEFTSPGSRATRPNDDGLGGPSRFEGSVGRMEVAPLGARR